MVITVTCPSCSSSFPVDPAKIPEGGVNARCSTCSDVFRVEKPVEPDPIPSLDDFAPDPVAEATFAAPEPAFAAPEPAFAAPEPAFAAPEPAVAAPEPAPFAAEAEPEPKAADGWGAQQDEAPQVAPDPMPAVADEAAEIADPVPAADPFGQAAPFEQAAPVDQTPPPLPDLAESLPAPAADPLPPMPEPVTPEPEAPAVQGFTFGKRDPTDKAKRLARVLVSDMIMYNAERHQSAIAEGTLLEDFEEEIDKSWKEFVDQVGNELADGPGRKFWTDALNDILAKGEQVF